MLGVHLDMPHRQVLEDVVDGYFSACVSKAL